MPTDDLDFLNGRGSVINQVLIKGMPRSTLFTGSKRVADKLSSDLKGKVQNLLNLKFERIKHAHLIVVRCIWKMLALTGRFLDQMWLTCHTLPGCVIRMHMLTLDRNAVPSRSYLSMKTGTRLDWKKSSDKEHLEGNWMTSLSALFSPGQQPPCCITLNNCSPFQATQFISLTHLSSILTGARLAFGGKELTNHSIPDCYGALEPTAVFVPLNALLSEQHFHLVTTEVFGPVQVPQLQSSAHSSNSGCRF